MKFHKYGIICALFLSLFSVYGNLNETDLIKSGIVSIETIDSELIRFSTIKVIYDSNILTVKGYVTLKRITVQGHFEIIVISPANEVIERMSTEDRYYNKKRNRQVKFFSVESSLLPPKGSRIQIVFFEKNQ